METVSIQTSLDRLASTLGVAPNGHRERPNAGSRPIHEGRIFLNLPLDPTRQAGPAAGVYDVELRTNQGTALLPASDAVSRDTAPDLR